jgi:multiple sugar transport system ATP-binding protein
MTEGLAVERVSFSYAKGARRALSEVDLIVPAGEVLAIVGPSGSGKSTLLRLVSGLLAPAEGRVLIDGRDLTGVSPEARPVAMVFQGYALFPHLDVAANIGFGLAVRKVADRRQRVLAVAVRLGLADLLGRLPGELSGGERQRVALARALLREPAVFCLDEPLSSLDPVLRAASRRDLAGLLRADGRCALHVTHDQTEAMTLGDRVALLNDGVLEQIGSPRELYDSPASTFVATFIGTHPMSLLRPAAARVDVPAGVTTVGVRAEDVVLVPGEDAVVLAVDDLGHERIAEVDVGGDMLRARLPADVDARPGDRLGFSVGRHTRFGADGRRLP